MEGQRGYIHGLRVVTTAGSGASPREQCLLQFLRLVFGDGFVRVVHHMTCVRFYGGRVFPTFVLAKIQSMCLVAVLREVDDGWRSLSYNP